MSALEFYPSDASPLEHADIQRDLGYAYIALSEAEEREENCRKAIKAYKKAFKAYSDAASRLSAEGDPYALDVRNRADECHRSMEACKKILKVSKRLRKA